MLSWTRVGQDAAGSRCAWWKTSTCLTSRGGSSGVTAEAVEELGQPGTGGHHHGADPVVTGSVVHEEPVGRRFDPGERCVLPELGTAWRAARSSRVVTVRSGSR